MESGCALRRDNTLWTGVPTSNLPNKDCSNGSGSEVFRLWTKRSFTDVNVTFSLRNNGYVSGAEGERSWDGIKIWLRRQGGTGSVGLYTAEVNRRQGNIMIQKKCAGSDVYHILNAGPAGGLGRVDRRVGEGRRLDHEPAERLGEDHAHAPRPDGARGDRRRRRLRSVQDRRPRRASAATTRTSTPTTSS